jgi:hypothetical protein
MVSIVYLSKSAPSRMAEDLALAGYIIYEALEVSEVLHLCEYRQIDAVVIAPEVEDKQLIEVQLRQMTLKLKEHAKSADVVWELGNLFPLKSPGTVQ